MNAPKNSLLAALIFAIVALPAGAIGIYRWQQRVYSDGDTLRRSAGRDRTRDVLWQAPQPITELAAIPGEVYEPRLSWDGLTMLFVRGKAGANADIFASRRTPTGWSEPQALTDINTQADELGPELSADGSTLYFYSDRAGGSGGYDIWTAQRSDAISSDGVSRWQTPVNLGPAVNSEFNDYGPAVAQDGRALYFASNRPQPGDTRQPDPQAWPATVREDWFKRTYDLYQSELTPAGAQPARPLVALNTSANEGAPCISPAGDFLYFTSDRKDGFGGFDLYRARVMRGIAQTAENLGPTINSPANELDPGLAQLGFALYFSSDRQAETEKHDAERRYRVYYTASREVFVDQDPLDWAALWRVSWPVLAWLLLALLAGLLLRQLIKDIRDGRLSLLARCLMASVLLHCLLLMGLGYWKVKAAVGEFLGGRGKVKVMLAAAGVGGDLVAQVRGNLITNTAAPAAAMPETPRVAPLTTIAEPRPQLVEAAASSVEVNASLAAEAAPRETRPSAAPPMPSVSEAIARLSLNGPEAVQPVAAAERTLAAPKSVQEETIRPIPALSRNPARPTAVQPTVNVDQSPALHAISVNPMASVRDAGAVSASAARLPASLGDSSTTAMKVATPQPREVTATSERAAGDAVSMSTTLMDAGRARRPLPPPLPVEGSAIQIVAPQPSVAIAPNAGNMRDSITPLADVTARSPSTPTSAPSTPAFSDTGLAFALPKAAPASAPTNPAAGAEQRAAVQPVNTAAIPRPSVGRANPTADSARAVVVAPTASPAVAHDVTLAGDAQPDLSDKRLDRRGGGATSPAAGIDAPLGMLPLGLPTPAPAGKPEAQARSASGALRGVVTDAQTGQPLAAATIRFDQAQGEPLTAVTDQNGTYTLAVAETPDNFAVTATHDGFLPESRNMRGADVRGKTPRLNFALHPANESVIAVEDDPEVHHLGNDRFEGRINSQFQRKSEGVTLLGEFPVSAEQAPPKLARVAVSMMVKGVQCPHEVRINGTLVARRLDRSPADGSFGELVLPFEASLLHAGDNQISVTAVSCNGDLDDFEFVNVQIRLTRQP